MRLKKVNQPVINQSQIDVSQPPIEKKTQEAQMNPTESMFKTFKRNHDIKINVEFTDKIGNPEFIKLMMENMDGDIVGFYKTLIVENIKNNFKLIEDEVEKQIRKEIFEEVDSKKLDYDLKKTIETITKMSKQIVDKSDEIKFNDELDDDYLDKQEESIKLSNKLVEMSDKLTDEIGKLDYLDEEVNRMMGPEDEPSDLILGGKTPAGKQLYKYIDNNGKIKEVLPETAKKNGWKPLLEKEN